MDEEKEVIVSEVPKEESTSVSDGKSLGVTIAVVVGIFVVLIGGFFLYNHFAGPAVMTLDELHQQNFAGKLDPDEGYLYNGFSFVKFEDLWWTEIYAGGQRVQLPLHFGPREVESIPIQGTLSDAFNAGDTVYVAIDPNAQGGHYAVAMSELSASIGQGINRNSKGACTTEDSRCGDRKILNCEEPQGLPVVELAVAEESSVVGYGSCIKISGTEYDLIKATERLLYQWYGVIE